MRVRPEPGVTATVLESGELLLLTSSGTTHKFAPLAAAMWIALRQHNGNLGEAADALSVLWNSESVLIRAELEMWADELRAAGLIRTEP
ncbi:PqqD family protein [Streptomyces mirabilis]